MFNPQFSAGFRNLPNGFDSISVPKDPFGSLLFCPSPIAIHNNGYVLWQIVKIDQTLHAKRSRLKNGVQSWLFFFFL
jgi:hypothetical protein